MVSNRLSKQVLIDVENLDIVNDMECYRSDTTCTRLGSDWISNKGKCGLVGVVCRYLMVY